MKEQNRKRTMWILGGSIGALVVLGILASAVWLKNQEKPEVDGESAAPTLIQSSGSSQAGVTAGAPPSSTAQAGEGDWTLRLVNRNHPLEGDLKINLTTFGNNHHFDSRAFPYLQQMLKAARDQGLKPLVCASYRTQAQQQELFDNKVRRLEQKGYSKEDALKTAKEWVAYPGTSEHQAGLAVDIVSRDYQLLEENQKNTPEAKWLREHCWKYGFILRYPEDKTSITGVGFEPWHFRYVGKDAAEKIMKRGICLEEYLKTN